MKVTAKLRYLHIAPRKVRLVADLVRGKSFEQAQRILDLTNKEATRPVLKLLESAGANAKNDFQIEENNIYIAEVFVDEGPKLKRWRARSRGRAAEIQKKTSHITIILEEIDKKAVKPEKKKKTEAIKSKKVVSKKEAEKKEVETITEEPEAQKFRPRLKMAMPKIQKGAKRIFKRKSF